jgi:SpoVK/Ycf46/Vps4 family AAA+-type ATPase
MIHLKLTEEPTFTNLDELKRSCEREVRETFFGKKKTKGILMYGPSGTGKTRMFEDIYNDLTKKGHDVQIIKLDERIEPREAQKLFDKKVAEAKKSGKNTILIIEEMDRLLPTRKTGTNPNLSVFVGNFLSYLNGTSIADRIFIVGNTNRIKDVEEAIYKQERLIPVFVNLPDEKTRKKVLQNCIHPKNLIGINIDYVVKKTEGFNLSQIKSLCDEAKRHAGEKTLERNDFEYAFQRVPGFSKSYLRPYTVEWRKVGSRLP